MKKTFLNKYKFQILIFLHILIGVLATSRAFILVFSSLLLLAVFHIISSKNNRNLAIYWCVYAMSAEVLFRIAKGAIFHEYVKYLCILFLIAGIITQKLKNRNSANYVIYILLLLVSIIFAQQDSFDAFRQEVSFNLSGPILLGIASIYLNNKVFSVNQILDLIKISLLPIISILIYLLLYTTSISKISFFSAANFETTGGFGPNQVSTVLGFGIFVFVVLFTYKKKITNFLILDFIIFGFLIYRELLTFSRGGLIAGVFASIIVIILYLKNKPNFIVNFFKMSLVTFVFGVLIFNYTSEKTSDILTYRYSGKNTYGGDKADMSAGRIGYFKDELNIFLDNPFFGAGVGGSKYEREKKYSHKGSSHNEITRMMSEHGIIGVSLLLFLIIYPLNIIYKNRKNTEFSFSLAFLVLWFLTINHSAMRLAFPAIVYGLSLINIKKNGNIIYR